MEVDVARPAATFEYELASKDMILVPPHERAKGISSAGSSKRKTRAADVPRRIGIRRRVHSDFDLDAGLREDSPASAASNSEPVLNESIISSPQARVFRLCLVGQPDSHRIAVASPDLHRIAVPSPR
jgi:hypothetical protein